MVSLIFLPCSAVNLTSVHVKGKVQSSTGPQVYWFIVGGGGDQYVWDQNHLHWTFLDHRGAGGSLEQLLVGALLQSLALILNN